jgi:nicotinamidase/pyrazinamidase
MSANIAHLITANVLVDPAETASIDVDAQNCFTPLCPKELPVPGGQFIVNELNKNAKRAQFRLGSKDSHPENAYWVATDEYPQLSPVTGHNLDLRWNLHGVPGTFGHQLIEGLPHPRHYDFFVYKGVERDMHPYGICYHDFAEKVSTGTIEFLQAKKVTTVIVGGLAFDYCVLVTVLNLCAAGFRVVVNLDSCRAIATETLKTAAHKMVNAGAILVNNAENIKFGDNHVF